MTDSWSDFFAVKNIAMNIIALGLSRILNKCITSNFSSARFIEADGVFHSKSIKNIYFNQKQSLSREFQMATAIWREVNFIKERALIKSQ